MKKFTRIEEAQEAQEAQGVQETQEDGAEKIEGFIKNMRQNIRDGEGFSLILKSFKRGSEMTRTLIEDKRSGERYGIIEEAEELKTLAENFSTWPADAIHFGRGSAFGVMEHGGRVYLLEQQ